MRQDLVHCSGPILEIYQHCLSHCRKLKTVPILVSGTRPIEMLGSWMDSRLVTCPFQIPPSRFRAFLPTEFTKARDSSSSRLKVPEAKKTHVRQNRSSQKPSIEIIKHTHIYICIYIYKRSIFFWMLKHLARSKISEKAISRINV